LIVHKPPAIAYFLATPFLVLGYAAAWICNKILPEDVFFIDMNDRIEFESEEEYQDYFNDEDDDDFYK
jgi:hypothetical protein